jgi:hypothetical protein
VRIIEGNASGRAAVNRNRLLAANRCDFLITVDGDDRLLPEWRREVQAAITSGSSQPDLVFCDYSFSTSENADAMHSALRSRGLYEAIMVQSTGTDVAGIYELDPGAVQKIALRDASPMHTVNCAIRTEYLRSQGLWWDDRFRVAEDTDFFVRVARNARCVFIDRVLAQYRLGEGGLTKTTRLESDLARVVQRQTLMLEALRSGAVDVATVNALAHRMAAAEYDLAYHLRKHGAPWHALRVALRATMLTPSRRLAVEILKSLAEGLIGRRPHSDMDYWLHTATRVHSGPKSNSEPAAKRR